MTRKLVLDQAKLLGFRVLEVKARPDASGRECGIVGAKIGKVTAPGKLCAKVGKVDEKAGKLGAKVGKLGAKVGKTFVSARLGAKVGKIIIRR